MIPAAAHRAAVRGVLAVLLSVAALTGGALDSSAASPPAAAPDGGAAQAIAVLNAQRAANGIPAGITVDPQLSRDCAAHDRYMARGHGLTHREISGAPGYSSGGAYAAAHAVLAQGSGWETGDPYDNAPLHLDQLLAPRLSTAGSADLLGFSCTTTFPGWTRAEPGAPSVYTFPGPGATAPPSEIARESPWTPGGLVGIRPGTRTGPVLLVLADAPGQPPADNPATLSQASLIGPQGSVAMRTVDGETPTPGGGVLAPYISPGGFLIPLCPLTRGASYHAHVLVSFAGQQLPHSWSFTVTGRDPHSTLVARGNSLAFTSASSRPIRVTFIRAGGARATPVSIAPGHRARVRLVPGSWQACGRQEASRDFSAYEGCLTLTVTGVPQLTLGSPQVHGGQLRLALRLSRVLAHRRARLTLTPLALRCAGRRCTVTPGWPQARLITLNGPELRVPLPARGHGVLVRLTTTAFQVRDAPWRAARASFRWVRR
ncbi:MAG: hypothetical protein M3Z27_04700 [Actinomycetota bacterium]|nr:hypothetical protein [Actinomycetota bacterium]